MVTMAILMRVFLLWNRNTLTQLDDSVSKNRPSKFDGVSGDDTQSSLTALHAKME